jgi:hypothetical protein
MMECWGGDCCYMIPPFHIMRSGWLCRVSSVSACLLDHISFIAAHKIS